MPAFTQEELDKFAHQETVERSDDTYQSTNQAMSVVVNGEVMDSGGDMEMKQELEPDVQDVPAETETDDRMKDEPAEEFVEAAEHQSPPAEDEDEEEQKQVEEDVIMNDVDKTEDEHLTAIRSQTRPEGDQETEEDDGESESQSDSQSGSTEEEEEEDEDDEEDEEDEEEEALDDGEQSASSESSDDESASEVESDSEEEEQDELIEEEARISKTCMVCNNAEEGENTEAFEECTKCGSYGHSLCAQTAGLLREDEEARSWQCPNCAQTENSESPKDTSKRNRNSAPRLVRDLLPVSRGVQKPNSHSIFAQPLISEGEDGGRSLRKRKSPTVEPPVSEKRRRKATPKALSAALPDDSKSDSVAHVTRRASQKAIPTARILQYRPYEKAPPHKFILAFRLDQNKIEKILNKPPRPGRRKRDRKRPPKILPPPIFQPPVPKFPALPTNHLIFPSMWGDRENEANAKPYGGILSETEADTSRSLPQLKDRELFEIARKEAEEERRKTSAAAEAEINGENANTTKPNRTVSGPPSKIKCIQFGKHVIDTFYAAPYPEEYSHESRLFICEFCLKYLPSEFVAYRHKLKCPAKHPPGDEIYRDGSISIWEVDGRKKTEYCQCLCLMAKMFLGSKTLYYDVEPFLFYILTEYDELGYHFVGYFSKEKRPASQNNVSCILVMPIHQRKGYATFLIDFSYLLTRIEGKEGSPEKPLSDMGLTAYRSYWDLTIARQLLKIGMKPFSTRDLMQRTGMTADDVVHSLERLYAFIKDPMTKAYAIRYDKKLYESIVLEFESKKHRELKPDSLIWTPYIMGRSDQAHLDTQPVQTIAPRESDEDVEEDDDTQQTKSKDGKTKEADNISPKDLHDLSGQTLIHNESTDPRLVNGEGHIAPGPPSAQLLTGSVVAKEIPQINGNANKESEHESQQEESVTGYALIVRGNKIPPSRFQIDPPIPPSMLRNRSHKKRNTGFARTAANGEATQSSVTMMPVRSSPRHAASVNGSVNGNTDNGSPEKLSTPIRRSGRKSGLSNMETIGLDGSEDPDEQEVGDEIEAKIESASESESSDEDEEENDEDDEDEEESAEDDDGGDEDDEDAEIPDDEDEDEDEEDEEADDDPDALDIANEESDETEESEDD